MDTPRRPKNKAEGMCWDILTEKGWEVTKRGWPDFIAWHDDQPIFVEVKPNQNTALKDRQLHIMDVLAGAGLRCYRYSPDVGFTALTRDNGAPLVETPLMEQEAGAA